MGFLTETPSISQCSGFRCELEDRVMVEDVLENEGHENISSAFENEYHVVNHVTDTGLHLPVVISNVPPYL